MRVLTGTRVPAKTGVPLRISGERCMTGFRFRGVIGPSTNSRPAEGSLILPHPLPFPQPRPLVSRVHTYAVDGCFGEVIPTRRAPDQVRQVCHATMLRPAHQASILSTLDSSPSMTYH